MATRVGVTAGLTEASVRELVASAHQDHRPLPFALFEARSCRAGGFMVVFPFLETIVSYLENWVDLEGSPMVLTSVVEVELETSRGRTFNRVGAASRFFLGSSGIFPATTNKQVIGFDGHTTIQAAEHRAAAESFSSMGSCRAMDQCPVFGGNPFSGVCDSSRRGRCRREPKRIRAPTCLRRCRPNGAGRHHSADAGSTSGTRIEDFDSSVKSPACSTIPEFVQSTTPTEFGHSYLGETSGSCWTTTSTFKLGPERDNPECPLLRTTSWRQRWRPKSSTRTSLPP